MSAFSKVFNKKPIYKNLYPLYDGNVRNLWPSPLFLLHTQVWFLKILVWKNLYIMQN